MHGVTSFYWPRSFHVNYTFGKPRSFSAELTEDGGVSFLNHDGRLSLPERRGKTKTLCVKGMWIAVQLPPRKLVLHPLTHHLGFQARGFHTSTQVFSDATPKSSDLSTPTTRPTAVVLLDAPPQTKSATSRIGSFVFFFCLHLLWSVFRQQRHAGKWWHLQLEWPLYSKDCPAGDEHRASTDDELNLSIWAVLLQYQFSPCIHHPLPSWIRLSRHSTRNLMWWLHMVSVTITTLTYPALSPKQDMPAILQRIFLVLVTGDGKDNTPYDAVYT